VRPLIFDHPADLRALRMLYASGGRPLGIEAAQLVAIARWMAKNAGL
jgi:hypothetical protein